MRIITYDCEVTKHDWLVVFKDKESGNYTCIWNDNEALRECISDDNIYVGFNSKHYDQFIIKAICNDFTNIEIKKLNDYIIGGNQGWDYPELKGLFFKFNNVDIRDDMQLGMSLKSIEGHLGMDIRESTIPFDINRPLTKEEKDEMVFYCKHDVDTTEKLIDIRKDYLKNKINIGKLVGIDEIRAMSMTNAKLTSAMLQASKKEHDDERNYVYPTNLLREYIPNEVFNFFDMIHVDFLSDEDVFTSKYEFMIGDCVVVIGFGGVHGAIPHYFFTQDSNRVIRNKDVGSYYPHLMTLYNYTSRNIPNAKIFENILDTRMEAKSKGDKATANALKLVVNTTYGASLNKYNDLYDPLMGRSVCITGQLFLLELAMHLYTEIESLIIVQLNTDGIMYECDINDVNLVDEICDEWIKRTGFDLETDEVIKLAQKDVNNYIEVQSNGDIKTKGGYLVRGITTQGAFKVNNNCTIVSTALKENLINDIPVEQTITDCNDLSQFQMIAKAGAKYKEAYHIVDGKKESVQKVNRVYASKDERFGKIYKVKAENSSEAKIESLPEHCVIDNDNHLTINDIDKNFYIELAKKRVNDFKGIGPEKSKIKRRTKMATTTKKEPTLNVYEKLIKARLEFLNENVKKSGKNMNLRFTYFELDDIVPIATKIFYELGLIAIVNFTNEIATLTIRNTSESTNENEKITFSVPFTQMDPITSNVGKQVTNSMQALGSSITYVRRYLYMIALDICEHDAIDGEMIGQHVSTDSTELNRKIPVSAEQRQEIKKDLASPEEKATSLQIKGLKSVLKKLKESQPDKEEFIAEVAVKTGGFTNVSKIACESLIQEITKMLEGDK